MIKWNWRRLLAMQLYKQLSASRLAGICMTLLGTVALAHTVRAEDYTKSYSVSNRANLRVDTSDGSVTITTGDAKQVEFHVEYHGYELNKNLIIESHQTGDEIELSARI